MLKKLCLLVYGRDFTLRERLFRASLLVGSIVVFSGIIESMLVGCNLSTVILLFFLLMVLGVALFATFKYRKMDFSATVIGLVIILAVFPDVFFLSGGIEGGAAIWFVFGMFYIFMMFSGKKLIFFFLLDMVVNAMAYGVAYFHPEYVHPLSARFNVFFDSFFAVTLVGCIGGLILNFQMKLFEMERKITEQQKEELEKVSNSKNKFFASMSHEIRTPINAIIGLNEMILRENNTGKTREYAENIQIASKMLLNLVNDILDLSQLEMKRMEIIPAEYQTTELFEELVDMIQIRAKEKKLDFIVDIDENIPSVLYGDKKRIQQVLLNILTNAVKYTNSGSVILNAHAEKVRPDAISLKVTVTDTGIGIRKEDLEYIYDSFKRVDAKRNTGIEGSGLGLSICKYLVDLMDGELTVDSIYTKGSVFTVILEQNIVDETPVGTVRFFEQDRNGKQEAYKQSFEAPEARILVVDDNEVNRYVVAQLLAATKVQIDQAESGMECLEKTKQKFYHVIIMDYMMPEMDGAETLRKVRKQENGLCRESAVLLLSADSVGETRKLCMENRFDGYLEKPVQGDILEEEILKQLPEEIIEYREKKRTSGKSENFIRQISGRKRKNIYITSDCVCELPEDLLAKYDIKLMYFYIKTEKGRFTDTREIDSNSLAQYLSQEGGIAYVDGASVEEYEEFFASMLTQADHVIHISLASRVGKSYETAKAAAKGFDHVHVIDSGLVSCGQGLVVLYAAKLASEGYHTHEICEMIEKMKTRVEANFMIPDTQIYYQHGYMKQATAKICHAFQLHPVMTARQSRMVMVGMRSGKLERAWKHYIRSHLRRKRRINTDIVIITHVGCTVQQLELIREEILRTVPFEKVIIQKASVSNACISGMGTIGISYYLKI